MLVGSQDGDGYSFRLRLWWFKHLQEVIDNYIKLPSQFKNLLQKHDNAPLQFTTAQNITNYYSVLLQFEIGTLLQNMTSAIAMNDSYYKSRQLLLQFRIGFTMYNLITIHDRTQRDRSNLVPRVLGLFGQRLVAKKDSGILEFFHRKIFAVKRCRYGSANANAKRKKKKHSKTPSLVWGGRHASPSKCR